MKALWCAMFLVCGLCGSRVPRSRHAARLASAVVRAKRRGTDWLIMVYITADNGHSNDGDTNLLQLTRVGSSSRATVVTQASWRGADRKTRRYLIKKDQLVKLANLGKIDSGNKKTLADFAIAMIKKYPARKLMLILWDQESGFNTCVFSLKKAICEDQTHVSIMGGVDVRDALAAVQHATRRTFDIVACDACLMQMLEFGTLMVPYTRFLVAAEDMMPIGGLNYMTMLKPLKRGTLSVPDFAKKMVHDFGFMHRLNFWDVTLSAVNTAKLPLLERNVDEVGGLLCQCLDQRYEATMTTIAHCLKAPTCIHFAVEAHIDLASWYRTVLAHVADFGVTPELQVALTQTLNRGLVLLRNAVVARTKMRAMAVAEGISLCFPIDCDYEAYAGTPFAKASRWLTFLDRYYTRQRNERELAFYKKRVEWGWERDTQKPAQT